MSKLIIAIALSFVSFQLSVVSSLAVGKNDFSLSVSPSILEIQAKPPANPQAKIKTTNNTENSLSLNVQLMPFRLGANGQVEYLSAADAKPVLVRIQKHIQILDANTPVNAIKLGPLESKELTLTIDVNEKLASGDYYLAVVLSSDNSSSAIKSNVRSSGGIATLVILSIKPGETMGRISQFSSPIFTRGPVHFKALVDNDSNHYIIPRGRIIIRDIFGNTAGRVDILPQYVLANSNRYLSDSNRAGIKTQSIIWPEEFLIGLYKAELTLKLSDTGPTITESVAFLSLPLNYIILFSTISFIICGILFKAHKLRKKNAIR